MLKLRIGNKSAFFFCGTIALSRKSNPTVSVDLDTLDDKIARGILRGITTQTIFCDEGFESLEAKLVVQEAVIEEVETVVDTPKEPETPAADVEVTDSSVQVEDAKKPTTRQTKARATK